MRALGERNAHGTAAEVRLAIRHSIEREATRAKLERMSDAELDAGRCSVSTDPGPGGQEHGA